MEFTADQLPLLLDRLDYTALAPPLSRLLEAFQAAWQVGVLPGVA